MRKLALLVAAAAILSLLAFAHVLTRTEAGPSGQMYWTDATADKIQRANLDGSNIEDLITSGLDRALFLALDGPNSKMYWTDDGTRKIHRANLDGSSPEVVVPTGLSLPSGIALDLPAGKMYFTDVGYDRIQRADLDGTNIETLVSSGLTAPAGIALDLAGGKMYWADASGQTIKRAGLGGTNVQTIVSGLVFPDGIALDLVAGKVYWTDPGAAKVQRANLDGSNVEDLVTSGVSLPIGIALDLDAGKMYWANYGSGTVQRANLDGTGVEDLVTTLTQPVGLALAPCFDNDADTLCDEADPDDDNDGCTDAQEQGTNQTQGGQRNPLLFWDFFDTWTPDPDMSGNYLKDRAVSGLDFFAVLGRFNATGPTYPSPPAKQDALADALTQPPAAPAYSAAYDRTAPGMGGDPWDAGPPDGAISGVDFFLVLAQFNHTCLP